MANITITARVRSLSTNERAGHFFTHEATFGPAGDNSFSTQTSNGDGIVFNIFPAANTGYIMYRWALSCDPALANTADAAFNTNTVSFGDAGSATRYINANQCNTNGTPTLYAQGTTANLYTSDSQITLTVNGQSAKNLAALNAGKIVLLFALTSIKGQFIDAA